MIDRMPRRLRVAFRRADAPADTSLETAVDTSTRSAGPDGGAEVDFVAYGEDCVLSGRTRLDDDRLTDMLNANDEYALIGVTVERFDGGPSIEVADVVVPRDELSMVHASGPRGDADRRQRTAQQYVAIKMGPYSIRGFYHALPGTDPVTAIRRRKPMVPITGARIEYTLGGEARQARVDTLIVNRDQIEWIEAVEPDRADFPVHQRKLATDQP